MDDLLKIIKDYNPNANFDLIKKAYDFASVAHQGQFRLSGEPFVSHPVTVAKILAGWKMDSTSIAVGLIHDTVEEGPTTIEDVTKVFGEDIAKFVNSLSVVGQIKLRGSDEEELIEGLRKMFLVMAQDLRVVVIKLADRMHNMQTLEYQPPEKQRIIAKETIDIYAPLADRLGMGEVKGELEDLAFPYLYPEDYRWLADYSSLFYKDAEEHIKEIRQKLMRQFAEQKLPATVHGRKKHLYSLYKKLLRPEIDKDIGKIHDLVALRILVDTIEQCYLALGITHKIYKPVPSIGISDFIAVPKPNGYRSIHTKIFGPKGQIVETQIRTYGMHEEAEYGVAAHFFYAALKNKGTSDEKLESGKIFTPTEKLSWVKQLANWQQEISDNQEFMQGLKFDALSHRIFVFTPLGDVKDLPAGATPIDFAYTVHTELGDRTVGAKVNGKMVPFDYQLKSGDICEIVLSKEPRKPNIKWLDFAITQLAKREIQKGLRSEI